MLQNDNAPTYFSTQINMYKQMAWIHACTPTGMHARSFKCAVHTNHMNVDIFEVELKHQDGGVFRTWCLHIESKICLHGFRVY